MSYEFGVQIAWIGMKLRAAKMCIGWCLTVTYLAVRQIRHFSGDGFQMFPIYCSLFKAVWGFTGVAGF